jgi:predicted Fe-Mo cluster-binding NifX family protein
VLTFLGVPVEKPVTVHVDNIGAIFMIDNPSSSSRTRHMSTRYFYVMDLQNDKVIVVKFIGSAKNLANVATKNVPVQVHEQHIDKITVERSSVDR